MKLNNYLLSSASYRVRIALALKGLSYKYFAVHLVKNEQLGEAFRALSPGQLVPALERDDADAAPLTQSLAILEYLEETHPEPPLLPQDAAGALMTTREGGASVGPYASMNLGVAVGDDPKTVAANRDFFAAACRAAPVFLRQVHGTRVVRIGAADAAPGAADHAADASVTT